MKIHFTHVDVFSTEALSGNGTIVFFLEEDLPNSLLLRITQEMRQFESIFLKKPFSGDIEVKIFTVEEQLNFAGHPLLGAACALHLKSGATTSSKWSFALSARTVKVEVKQEKMSTNAWMDQGIPCFLRTLSSTESSMVLDGLNLSASNLSPVFPCEVVSTGLPYLIVPIKNGLDRARVCVANFSMVLNQFGAKFVYVLDVEQIEGRTWDNHGKTEDVATGSAAGPVAAFIRKHQPQREAIVLLKQGRFCDRPSIIQVRIEPDGRLFVGGDVVQIATGTLQL